METIKQLEKTVKELETRIFVLEQYLKDHALETRITTLEKALKTETETFNNLLVAVCRAQPDTKAAISEAVSHTMRRLKINTETTPRDMERLETLKNHLNAPPPKDYEQDP